MLADLPHDVLPKLQRVLQEAVLVAQELDGLGAHHGGGVPLLLLANDGQLLRLDFRV